MPEYSSFYLNTFNIITKLSLQNKAKEEKLFETGDWTSEGQRDELIKNSYVAAILGYGMEYSFSIYQRMRIALKSRSTSMENHRI